MSSIISALKNQSIEMLLAEGAIVALLFAKVQEASATPTPTPTPQPGTPTLSGFYGPLYDARMRTAMVPLNDSMDGYPNLFTINPASGPVALGARVDVENECRSLKTGNATCKRLGYIASNYGNQTGPRNTLAGIKAQVDMWDTWRAAGLIEGIMWDEQANTLDKLPFYTEITKYARDKGLTFIRGNPGAKTPREYIRLNDVTSVHEGPSQPTETAIKDMTYYPEFSKQKFNYLQDAKPSLDIPYVKMLTKYFGTIYITDQSGDPIRYFIPATYLSQLVQTIKETPAS